MGIETVTSHTPVTYVILVLVSHSHSTRFILLFSLRTGSHMGYMAKTKITRAPLAQLADFSFRPIPHLGACLQATFFYIHLLTNFGRVVNSQAPSYDSNLSAWV